jgi:hypothetical protein
MHESLLCSSADDGRFNSEDNTKIFELLLSRTLILGSSYAPILHYFLAELVNIHRGEVRAPYNWEGKWLAAFAARDLYKRSLY